MIPQNKNAESKHVHKIFDTILRVEDILRMEKFSFYTDDVVRELKLF